MLEKIQKPNDIKKIPADQLPALAEEIREFIIESLSKTGGHLASNLGVVELTIAMHRVFDLPKDKLIWDVGHQSYTHKILTGRKDGFETLRREGGISGFPKRSESDCDVFDTGHSSTSISAGVGYVRARELKKENYSVVSIIGDGALTGGMAYEALSNAGTSGEPLLVVLNDNNMSIAKNVGGLSRHLSRLRVSPRYLGAKVRIKEKLARIPGGRALTQSISRTKARIKGFLLPTSLFEQMGFTYLGPVDGHDLKSVCELLAQAKKMKKPVLLHVMTQKGRGYAPSENNPEKYHGVSQFDRVTGEFLAKKKEDFSARFGAELCGLADKDARICAITAAMPSGTGLTRFSTLHRDRFFDVGIAEEHAVAMAAGMAAQGLVPVVALYSTFLQRAYDQVVHDVAIEGLHVVFCIDRAGIVGADGATHNGVLDIAFLRSIPGVTILCPSSFAELRSMMTRAVYHENGPVAIRYPRGGEGAWRGDTSSQPLACVRQTAGHEVTLVTHGIMINETLAAAEKLESRGVRTQVCKVNELSPALEQALAAQEDALSGLCVVVEDTVDNGGVGEWLASHRSGRTLCISTGNRFLPHGSVNDLYRHCGLDADGIAEFVMEHRKETGLG